MTCIVGFETQGGAWLGADSAATDAAGGSIVIRQQKVFRVDGPRHRPLGIAVAGSPRLLQILRYDLKVPAHPASLPDEVWLHTKLVPAIRRVCLESGTEIPFAPELGGDGSPYIPISALLAYRGAVYTFGSTYFLLRSDKSYSAGGSGDTLALGAFHALDRMIGLSPEFRVDAALQAAAEHQSTVRPPFHRIFLPC